MDSRTGVISAVQEIEVLAKAGRRRFPAEDKRRVLQEADACTKPGELGALRRREGLYSSHLSAWRAAREAEGLVEVPKKLSQLLGIARPARNGAR